MEVPFLVILTLVNNPVYVKVILVDVEALDNVVKDGNVSTEFDALEADDVPLVLVAVTVKVYVVFAINPATVMGDTPVPVKLPGLLVAV